MSTGKPKPILLLQAVRLFAVFGRSLLCFPFLPAGLLLLGLPESWALPLQTLCSALCFLGLGTAILLQKCPRGPRWLWGLISWIAGLLPGAAGAFVGFFSLHLPLPDALLLGAFLLLPWILGMLAQGKAYDQVLHRNFYLAYLVFSFCALAVYLFHQTAFPTAPYVVCLLLMASGYGLSLNQGNLDRLMERRGHSFSQLPERIRWYNVRLLALVLVGILILALFAGPLAQAGRGALSLIGQGISFFFSWLSSFFATSSEPGEETDTPMSPLLDESASGIWNVSVFLLGILILVLAVILITKGGRALLRRLGRALLEWLRRLLHWLESLFFRKPKADPEKIESEYYVDEDIRIAPALAELPKDLTRRQRLRQWKKARRQFRQMPDGPEKFRFGYGLALEGAKLRGLSVSPGDTPLELSQKLSPALGESFANPVTPAYNRVRYGEKSEELPLGELQSLLEELEKLMPQPVEKQSYI